MKIIIYNPLGNTKGHSKVYASGIINGFLKRNFETHLITSSDFDNSAIINNKLNIERTKLISNNNIYSIKSMDKFKYAFFLLFNTIRSFSYLRKHCNRKNIILIIGGDSLFNAVLLLFTPNKDRIGLTIHNADYDLSIYKKDFIKLTYKFLSKLFIKTLTYSNLRIFCHGQYTSKILEGQLKLNSGRIKSYLVPIENLKINTHNSKSKNFNLLFIGIIRYDKGLDLLIEALNNIPEVDYKLHICGSTSQLGEERINNMLKKSNQPQRLVRKFGYLKENELEICFAKSTYIVLPYRKTFRAQSVVFTDSVKRYKPVISTIESQNGFDTNLYNLGETFQSENIISLTKAIKNAYFKWKKNNLPDPKNYERYLENSSPLQISKDITNAF